MLTTKELAQKLHKAPICENGTKELLHEVFLADKNYIVREPKEPYQSNELHWFISQSRNIEDLQRMAGFIPKIWKDIAQYDKIINSNYGWCCLSKENGSQFENAMKHLICDKNSRRAIMIYNRPSMHKDWMTKRGYGEDMTKLSPAQYKSIKGDFMCCQNNHFIIRDDKLHMTVHMRSMDAVYGYNADYIWFDFIFDKAVQMLKRKYENLERGDMVIYADSIHVYERHFEDLNEAVKEIKPHDMGVDNVDHIIKKIKEQKPMIMSNNPYLLDPDNNDAVMSDPVNHPNHYNANSLEHWDYAIEMGWGDGYLLSAATKYVFRNRHKGSRKTDLDKVVAYLKKYIESHNFDDTLMQVQSKKPKAFQLMDKLEDLNTDEKQILAHIERLYLCVNKDEAVRILGDITDGIEKLKEA